MNTSQSNKDLKQHPLPRPLLPVVIAFIVGVLLADKGLLSERVSLFLLLTDFSWFLVNTAHII